MNQAKFRNLKICPVCDSELYNNDLSSGTVRSCRNDCYSYVNTADFGHGIFIFGTLFILAKRSKEEVIRACEEATKEIEYWKENNKYLAKILESN